VVRQRALKNLECFLRRHRRGSLLWFPLPCREWRGRVTASDPARRCAGAPS
jgi:hypothetical protein